MWFEDGWGSWEMDSGQAEGFSLKKWTLQPEPDPQGWRRVEGVEGVDGLAVLA